MNATELTCSPGALDWLRGRDGRPAEAIGVIGIIRREKIPDPFSGLLRAVTGQQISAAAHAAVWKRFAAAAGEITPEAVLALGESGARAAGLSGRKADYALGIAREFVSGNLAAKNLAAMPDEEVINRLTALKGVGRWTAEMTLIFTFGRENVFSVADYGIRRGLRMLYSTPEITPAFAAKIKKRYSPFATAASLYLWEIASGKYPAWTDPAAKKS